MNAADGSVGSQWISMGLLDGVCRRIYAVRLQRLRADCRGFGLLPLQGLRGRVVGSRFQFGFS